MRCHIMLAIFELFDHPLRAHQPPRQRDGGDIG